MARPLRIEFAGALYHVTSRGDGRDDIYLEVADGKNQPSPWDDLKNQIFLGSEVFVEEMQRKVNRDQHLSEIPKTQRRPVAQPLTWYFEKHADRDTAIFEAYQSGGYNMQAIGDHVGLHYSRISRIISLTGKARGKT